MAYILGVILILILILIYAYMRQFAINYSILIKALLPLSIMLFTLAVIIYPEESYNAAFEGLKIWFNVVCPSLLPFLIGSELLINLGIVNFLGILLEPLMRPVFNVPGCGSFPFVMSITSGYPVGSKIVAQLYNNKLCNRTEAQRLLSFCSTSGPLFMIGAVAIGMLAIKGSGFVIAMSHYLGALSVGIVFRFYKLKDRTVIPSKTNIIKTAFKSLYQSLNNESRPLGLLLSEAVKNSINTLLLIGGFIVLFCVVIRLMILSNFITILSNSIYYLLSPLHISDQLLKPFISGLFEITIGSKLVAASDAAFIEKILAVCALISWSGFSIHAQVASMISNTDLKMSLYIFCKVLHSIFSCIYAYIIIIIWGIPGLPGSSYVFSHQNPITQITDIYNLGWVGTLTVSSGRFICTIFLLLVIAIAYIVLSKLVSFFSC